MLRLYNTLTKKEEIFKPIDKKRVGFYSCGPTVYDYDHIGHAWKYFNDDVLKRVLLYNGYDVKHVMNITDVGHLVSDADEGEDKLEKGARREGKTPKEIADFYTRIYLENRKKINLLEPDVICKATDHIKEMVELNQKLVEKGVAYETDDALYFDVAKFSKYGRLSGNTLDKLKAGARIEINPNKKHPYDFALWMKAVGKHESHAMVWNSPWGKGFPGWHIECSAMSMKYLGESFDIHTGGEDNIFPHHECEIAQSESATGKKFVNYWVHTRFLMVEGEKMSKSLKNFFRIQDIEEKGFNPLALRYLFLTTHYRSNLNFTWDSLKAAQNALDNLYKMITDIIKSEKNEKDFRKEAKAYHKNFLNFINDDLNVPQALALAWETLKDENLDNQEKYNLLLDFDKVFGLGLKNLKEAEIPEKIKILVRQREKSRQEKDFKKADEIRKEIEKMGFGLEDTDEETKVKPL